MKHRALLLISAALAAPASSAFAGDTYVKGGWMLVSQSDANDCWWASAGQDFRFHPAYLGFEIQSAYRHDRVGGKVESRLVPLNVFANGTWRGGEARSRPYVSAGVGLVSALVWSRVNIVSAFSSDFRFVRSVGFQVKGGVELDRRFLVEALLERAYTSVATVEANPNGPEMSFSVLGGVTW